MRTGLTWVDAREDFDRARRKASRAKLAGWLRGRSSRRNRLLVLGEATITTGAGGAVSSRSAGTRACHDEWASQALVPIDRIVGTVEPIRSFDRKFRPTSELPRTRFERIAAEARSGRRKEVDFKVIDHSDITHPDFRAYLSSSSLRA
jgi:hypothetical protein